MDASGSVKVQATTDLMVDEAVVAGDDVLLLAQSGSLTLNNTVDAGAATDDHIRRTQQSLRGSRPAEQQRRQQDQHAWVQPTNQCKLQWTKGLLRSNPSVEI